MPLTKQTFLTALLLLGGTVLPQTTHAAAPCDGFVTVSDASPVLEDTTPFANGNITANFTVTIAPGSVGCHGKLFVDKPLPSDTALQGALDIRYGGATVVRSDTVTSPAYVADIVDASPVVLQVVYRKDNISSEVVNSGNFTFNVPFYVKDGSGNTILRTSNKNFTIKIPRITHARLVSGLNAAYASGSNNTEIDFGDMTPNAARQFYLNVRSTTSYGVRVESDNGFALVGENNAALHAEKTVPYTLTFNGTVLTPSGQVVSVPVTGNATNATGVTHEFLATLGDTNNKRAGKYSDKLVITTSAY